MTAPEIPEGKVLVDEADLRSVCDWMEQRMARTVGPTRRSLGRLVAALPAPEWEPSERDVADYCEAWNIEPPSLYWRELLVASMKRVRARGWDAVPRRIGSTDG